MNSQQLAVRRQVAYWRLLSATFGLTEQAENFENMSLDLVDELEMPTMLLDSTMSVDNLLHRYPELEAEFKVNCHKGVSLYTIRHFDEKSLHVIPRGERILVEQRTDQTLQVVTYSEQKS